MTANITLNNIFSNYNSTGGYLQNIHITFLENLSLSNNWWGLTDVSAINQTIWNFKNDTTHLGIVSFTPFLNQSILNAPSVPTVIPVPTPPPSPIPGSSSSPSIATTSTSSDVATPPSSASETPTSSPLPYSTPDLTLTQTPQAPKGSPITMIGQFNMADITNILVIVLAVAFAVSIIFIINIKFRKAETRRSTRRQTPRRKPRKVFPEI